MHRSYVGAATSGSLSLLLRSAGASAGFGDNSWFANRSSEVMPPQSPRVRPRQLQGSISNVSQSVMLSTQNFSTKSYDDLRFCYESYLQWWDSDGTCRLAMYVSSLSLLRGRLWGGASYSANSWARIRHSPVVQALFQRELLQRELSPPLQKLRHPRHGSQSFSAALYQRRFCTNSRTCAKMPFGSGRE